MRAESHMSALASSSAHVPADLAVSVIAFTAVWILILIVIIRRLPSRPQRPTAGGSIRPSRPSASCWGAPVVQPSPRRKPCGRPPAPHPLPGSTRPHPQSDDRLLAHSCCRPRSRRGPYCPAHRRSWPARLRSTRRSSRPRTGAADEAAHLGQPILAGGYVAGLRRRHDDHHARAATFLLARRSFVRNSPPARTVCRIHLWWSCRRGAVGSEAGA